MKKLLAGVVILFSGMVSAQKIIINDPNAEGRTISGFNSISVSDGIDLYLSQGDEEGVAVSSGDTRFNDRIITTVNNSELKIYYHHNGSKKYPTSNKKMIAYISFKTLNRLSASGASDVHVNGIITGEALNIKLSGASDFQGKVQVSQLTIDQSGASDVSISGKASSLKVDASGASDLKGYDLETEQCNAEASGASDIKVTVKNELNARATGASSIYYKGEGQIRQSHTSGASNVSRKG